MHDSKFRIATLRPDDQARNLSVMAINNTSEKKLFYLKRIEPIEGNKYLIIPFKEDKVSSVIGFNGLYFSKFPLHFTDVGIVINEHRLVIFLLTGYDLET